MRDARMDSLTRSERRLVWVACLVPFASSLALILWYWPGSLPQDNASGVWTALAQDLARGIFYRPTADAFGFGGTRYMPLFFALHAGLIRLSGDPVTAGRGFRRRAGGLCRFSPLPGPPRRALVWN